MNDQDFRHPMAGKSFINIFFLLLTQNEFSTKSIEKNLFISS